jgi:hypothetical protein
MNNNFRRVKAIEKENKRRSKEINRDLNDDSGIYFLTREDENHIKYAYIGQAKHILSRLAQHMVGYQHIDLSLKKHGLYSFSNPYGWKVGFLNFPIEELDVKEQHYIRVYAQKGYQLRNKTSGSQGKGKVKINEFKASKTYYDGLKQGKKMLARELSHIIEKHLEIGFKDGKEHNKISINAREKFFALIDENNYRGSDENGETNRTDKYD